MEYLTTRQAASILRISQARIALLIRSGRLPAEKVGGIWLIKESDLAEFAKLPRPEGYPKGRPRKPTAGTDCNQL